MSGMLKAHYSASELEAMRLPGFPTSRVAIRTRAERESWPYVETKGLGGTKRLYDLPPQVRALVSQKLAADALRVAGASAEVDRPRSALPLNDKQKLAASARKGVLAALDRLMQASGAGREVDEIVQTALTAGKLLPAQESWARDLGKSNLAALKSFIESAPKVAALTGTQTAGRELGRQAQPEATDPTLVAVCRMFGNKPADVLKYAPGAEQ